MRQLQSILGIPTGGMPITMLPLTSGTRTLERYPQPEHPEGPHDLLCGPCSFETLRVALLVKYGGTIREAAFKFTEQVETILKNHNVNFGCDEKSASLTDKLEALKAEVGPETYDKLLANPEVEKMATRAYRRTTEGRIDKALEEISALLNNAIPLEQLAVTLGELSEAQDPVALLAEG